MAYQDHAVPSRTESSVIGNTQRRNGDTRKEHHNPQADAWQCLLDGFLTRYTESPNLRQKTKQQCTNFKNAVVHMDQCAELNNTNCAISYTSMGGNLHANVDHVGH